MKTIAVRLLKLRAITTLLDHRDLPLDDRVIHMVPRTSFNMSGLEHLDACEVAAKAASYFDVRLLGLYEYAGGWYFFCVKEAAHA